MRGGISCRGQRVSILALLALLCGLVVRMHSRRGGSERFCEPRGQILIYTKSRMRRRDRNIYYVHHCLAVKTNFQPCRVRYTACVDGSVVPFITTSQIREVLERRDSNAAVVTLRW